MARLLRLMGRGRALEVLFGADDVRGDLAELYGYVNRSLPDAELDGFVDALATRIASFDKRAIIDTKRLVNAASSRRMSKSKPGGMRALHRWCVQPRRREGDQDVNGARLS